MQILGTGLSGLIGTRLTHVLRSTYEFQDMSLKTGIDITDTEKVKAIIGSSASSCVFHFAAVTDVDKAELEKGDRNGIFWKVNVDSTRSICQAAAKNGKRVVYLSTDYVFDGKHDSYSETDTPNPASWYAETKYRGENAVLEADSRNLVIRLANPYRSYPVGKLDFVHKIISKLRANESVQAPLDQIYVPTFIDDLVRAIDFLVKHNESGIFHVVGSEALTPLKATYDIAKTFGLRSDLIVSTTFEEFFHGRAPRPFHAALKHDKITALGMQMSSFVDGILIVKKQEAQTLS